MANRLEGRPSRGYPEPQLPAELWGLWAVSGDRPEGYWWHHTFGFFRG
jgi:hypothetical protein